MLGYDFEIIYKKGSRMWCQDLEALLCTIYFIQLDWINEAWEEWENDEEVWALIQKLQQDFQYI